MPRLTNAVPFALHQADKNPSELIASIAELQKQVLSSAPDVKQHAIETEQVQPKAVQQQQQQHQQHQAADAQQHVDMAMPAPTPAPTDAAHAVQVRAEARGSPDGISVGDQTPKTSTRACVKMRTWDAVCDRVAELDGLPHDRMWLLCTQS